jgi:hypothetical protein
MARVIFDQFNEMTGDRLIVGISRDGLHVVEVANVTGYEGMDGPYLVQSNVFSWAKFEPASGSTPVGRPRPARRRLSGGI